MKRKTPDTKLEERTLSPVTSSEASSENRSDRSVSISIEIQTQNIIELAAAHRGNPGKLTQTLLNNSYELEAIENAFLFLEASNSIPQHISLAVRNAIEKIQEENRETLVKSQADLIMGQVSELERNPQDLIENLINYSDYNGKAYKPDSFKYVLDNYSLSPQTHNALHKAYIIAKIGYVKERELDPAGVKPDGITSGEQVRKSREANDYNVKKHKTIWLQKSGDIQIGPSENVCEYIGTNLINYMMDTTSPKLRLHRDEYGDITLLSKYLEDFETLRDKDSATSRDLIKRSKNFANFFAANILIGDYDVHPGNVGIITTDRHYIARIDNGCALSYNIERSFSGKIKRNLSSPQTVEGFKQTMLSLSIYSAEMFEGIEFATDLQQAINAINPEETRQIIKLSIRNLKDAYGEDFLDDHDLAKDLEKRMGIPLPITEESITNTIIGNMLELKKELNEFAIAEMTHFFPSHPKQALEECVKLKEENSGFINYSILLDRMQTKFPKFDPQQQRYLKPRNNADLEISRIEAIASKLAKSNELNDSSPSTKKRRIPDRTPINITPQLKPSLHR